MMGLSTIWGMGWVVYLCTPLPVANLMHDTVTFKYTEGGLVFKTGSQLLTKSHNTDKETNLLDVDAHYSVLPVKKDQHVQDGAPGMAWHNNPTNVYFCLFPRAEEGP